MPSFKLKIQDNSGKDYEVPWYLDRDPTDREISALLMYKDKPQQLENFAKNTAGAESTSTKPKKGFIQGIKDTLVDPLIEQSHVAMKHIKEGNYPGAFHDIAAPITNPFEGVFGASTGNLPKEPEKQLAGQVGVNVDKVKEAAESGDYNRLIGQTLPILAGAYVGSRFNPRNKGFTYVGKDVPLEQRVPGLTPKDLSNQFQGEFGPVSQPENIFGSESKGSNGPNTLERMYEHVRENKGRSPKIKGEIEQELPFEFPDTSSQGGLKGSGIRSAGMTGDSPYIEAFEGLVPDRFKSETPISPFMEPSGPAQRELFTPQQAAGSEIKPMISEPRLMGSTSPTWASIAQQRKLPLDTDTVGSAESSSIPEIKNAAQQVVQSKMNESPAIKPESKVVFTKKDGYISNDKKQGVISRTADDFITSNMHVLISDSPAGKGIANLIDKYRAETGSISGNIQAAIKDTVEPLNKSQYTEWQSLMDKGGDSQDPMVQNALDIVRNIDNGFTGKAIQSGIHLKTASGEIVPFLGKENYWPRMYDPSLFANKAPFIERLIKQGLSPESAKKAVDNMRRFGERLIDPQNQRVLDLPEHRKDLGALLRHYDDMAHRIAAAEVFGVKDIADPNTPISRLVKQTKDPSRITRILTQYLDRDSGIAPHEADFVKKVSKLTTALYLSRFAISNSNQLANIPIVTNFTSTAKALGQFLKNPKRTWREAEATGALQTVMQEGLRDMGGESLLSKAYLIKASEGTNRTITAIAGKHYILDIYNKFLKNPNSPRLRRTLEDLTLENADTLKAQGSLTPKQIDYAAIRVNEKAQFRAQSIDLPYQWSNSPYMSLLLLYKKYAFMQNKAIKEFVKTNPVRNIPLMLGLYQLAGEVTGDTKAAIRGSITGNPQKEIEDRGKFFPVGHPIIGRVIQNYTDAMFLGLLGDALQAAQGGKSGLLQYTAGPVISLATETGGNIISDLGNSNSVIRHPSKSQTLRGLASHIPYIGPGVVKEMKNTKIHSH